MPDPRHAGVSPPALVDLYCSTSYDLRLPGGFRTSVRIGQPCPAPLREWIGKPTSAFLVSAGNPFSAHLEVNENRQRMRQLVLEIRANGKRCLAGVGHVPGFPWREPHLLVVDPDSCFVDNIARKYQQNAIVNLQLDRPAILRLYRTDWRSQLRESDDFEWAAKA